MNAHIRTGILVSLCNLGEADGLVAARVQAICGFLAGYGEDDRPLVVDILKATPRFATLATDVGLARAARLAAIVGILPQTAAETAGRRIDPDREAEALRIAERAGFAAAPDPETLFPEDATKPRKPRKAAA